MITRTTLRGFRAAYYAAGAFAVFVGGHMFYDAKDNPYIRWYEVLLFAVPCFIIGLASFGEGYYITGPNGETIDR